MIGKTAVSLAIVLFVATSLKTQDADAGLPSDAADDSVSRVNADSLSRPPRLITGATPVYPVAAAELDVEADVGLALDIDDQGRVTGVAVLEPAAQGGYGFDEAAVAAAYQLAFEPAERQGKPVPVQVTYQFKFRRKKEPASENKPPIAASSRPPLPVKPPAPKASPTLIDNFVGTLLERGTRHPIPGLLVTIFRDDGKKVDGFENTSDKQGRFVFKNLETGSWKVVIDASGYYDFKTTEEIHPREVTRVTYYVERESYNPFDVLVRASRPRKEVSRTVIESAVIEKMPGAAGDPLAVVQNFAGVARPALLGGAVIVRGSAPEETRVFIDAIEVPIIYHFGGLRSVLPVGMIDNLEFYPGNFSPYYGRATGGIIDVSTKRLRPKRIGGYADVSLLDAGLYLEMPVTDKGAIAVAARRSYVDAILGAVIPDDAPINFTSAPRYYDFQLLGKYRPAPAHELRLLFFGSNDAMAMLFKNPGEIDTRITSNRTSLSMNFYRGLITYHYVPDERFENTLRLSQGRDAFDIKFFQFYEKLTLYTTHLRNTSRYQLFESVSLLGGIDFAYENWSGSVYAPHPPKEGTTSTDLNKSYKSTISGTGFWLPAAFAELELRPIKPILLVPGVRIDGFSHISQITVAPRFTLRYQIFGPIALKGGIGLFYQPPDLEETNAQFGNPDLKAKKALHYSAGVEWRPLPYLALDATGFYKRLTRLVSPTNTTTVRNGEVQPLVYDNRGIGRVMGLELVARHEFSHNFFGWLAYTLSRSERRDSGARNYRLFDSDQTHILTAFATYKLPRNWQVGTRFRLASGNPNTPVVGAVYNASIDQYEPTYGAKGSARNALFHQLDIRVDKRWVFDGWMLTAYLDVQNVYNRSNMEGVSYNYDFNEWKPLQGLPILPIIGLRGEF